MIPQSLLTKRQAASSLGISTRPFDRLRSKGLDVGEVSLPTGGKRYDPVALSDVVNHFRRRPSTK